MVDVNILALEDPVLVESIIITFFIDLVLIVRLYGF